MEERSLENLLKQGILTLTQQGDALCMVHCDIAAHGSLFGLLMLYTVLVQLSVYADTPNMHVLGLFMWTAVHSSHVHTVM